MSTAPSCAGQMQVSCTTAAREEKIFPKSPICQKVLPIAVLGEITQSKLRNGRWEGPEWRQWWRQRQKHNDNKDYKDFNHWFCQKKEEKLQVVPLCPNMSKSKLSFIWSFLPFCIAIPAVLFCTLNSKFTWFKGILPRFVLFWFCRTHLCSKNFDDTDSNGQQEVFLVLGRGPGAREFVIAKNLLVCMTLKKWEFCLDLKKNFICFRMEVPTNEFTGPSSTRKRNQNKGNVNL